MKSTNSYLTLLASVALVVVAALCASVEAGPAGVFGTPDQVCGPNEEYTSCGSSCPDTCETILNPAAKRVCTMNCVPGCFCIADHVRDADKKCIAQFECKQGPRGLDGAAPGGALRPQSVFGVLFVVAAAVLHFSRNLLF
ncbi:hypothetical protein TYRP_004060 [Tyrophagus putrescentiae]|nr:hypothetical protein TYRP_004060 [Tyrophagus putrescentiae]